MEQQQPGRREVEEEDGSGRRRRRRRRNRSLLQEQQETPQSDVGAEVRGTSAGDTMHVVCKRSFSPFFILIAFNKPNDLPLRAFFNPVPITERTVLISRLAFNV